MKRDVCVCVCVHATSKINSPTCERTKLKYKNCGPEKLWTKTFKHFTLVPNLLPSSVCHPPLLDHQTGFYPFSFSPPSAATHLFTWRHYSFTLTSSFPLVFLLVVYSLLLMLPWWTCKWLNTGFVWLSDGMFSSEENNTNDLKCCDFAVYRTYKVWPCVYEVKIFSD